MMSQMSNIQEHLELVGQEREHQLLRLFRIAEYQEEHADEDAHPQRAEDGALHGPGEARIECLEREGDD